MASVASVINLDIALQPKQDELWRLVDESPVADIGYGGSRGGGKSGGARRIMILRRLKYAGTPGIILRRTWDDLYKNHLVPMFEEFPCLEEWWHANHKEIVFPNRSRLYFRYAEHAKDVKAIVGAELGDVCPEEAALFTKEELEWLKGSCRWTRNPSFTPKMIYPFMPGGPGHYYLKRIFYDKDYEGEERAERFAFIQAYGWDNVEWSRQALAHDGLTERDYYRWSDLKRREYFVTRTDYGKMLASLNDRQLREAWLEGSMEITEGMVFPELRDDTHNLDNFISDKEWDNWHASLSKFGCIDHASSGVTAYVQEGYSHEGIKFSLEEYYVRNRTISQHAKSIQQLMQRYGDQDYTLIDPSTEAKTLQGKNPQTNKDELYSVMDEYRRNGVQAMPARRTQVSTGLDLLKDLLSTHVTEDDGKGGSRMVLNTRLNPFTQKRGSPAWFISKKRCPNLWREIKELQRVFTPNGTWEFVGSDHALDDARYIAVSRPELPKPSSGPMTWDGLAAHAQQYTSIDQKANRAMSRFDRTFGKTPDENSWFPGK